MGGGRHEGRKHHAFVFIHTPCAQLVRVGLETLVGFDLLRDLIVGFDRKLQPHLPSAAERRMTLRGVELEPRRHLGSEFELGIEAMQVVGRQHPRPRLELHQLGDLVGVEW